MLSVQTRARRTQEERRTHTRRRLLEATLDCLAELGHRGTTTLEVERRAGVSRGARLHHFPSKAELLAGAIDLLYVQLRERYAAAFAQRAACRSARQRIRAGLQELFEIYQHPHYAAVVELHIAARTDGELRACMKRVADHHRHLAQVTASHLFPTLGADDAPPLVESIHAALLGIRLQAGVTTEAAHVQMVLAALEDLAVDRVERKERAG